MNQKSRLNRMLWVALPVVLAAGFVAAPASAQLPGARLEVCVTNISRQIMSPVIMASHSDDTRIFYVGMPVSEAVASVAEDAINDPLLAALAADDAVNQVIVITGAAGPIVPGEKACGELSAAGIYRYVSAVSMLVTTNDAFTGLDSFRSPGSRSATVYTDAYDAGSEANTESCEHIPGPPCGNAEERVTEGAEGVILVHPGIRGDGDVPLAMDWRNPVARFQFSRSFQ